MGRKTVFALVVISTFVSTVLGQKFGNFEIPGDIALGSKPSYWFHNIPLKIILVVSFSLLGLASFWVRKKALRYVLMISALTVNGFLMGGFLCPVTAVQNVFLKYKTGYLVLFLVPVIFAVLVGRIHCGYVCPYGLLQELIHLRKFGLKVPQKLDEVLRRFKYAFLIFLVIAVLFVNHVVVPSSPFKDLFNFGITAVTVVWIVLSVFVYRPFCRYVCPYGALLSIFSKFSIFKLKVDGNRCVNCRLCTLSCETGAMRDGELNNVECLMCGKCIESCRKSAIYFKI